MQNKNILRIISSLSAAILLILSLFVFVQLSSLRISADDGLESTLDNAGVAYIYNIENDTAIAEKNEFKIISTGASTKIMTGLLAIEHLGDDLDQKITVTKEMLEKASGRQKGFVVGEVVTVRQMLYATICGGYNDSACILAFTVADSYEDFIDMMNSRAAELGAKNTVYLNATGINEIGMYTTAADIAIIARAAYESSIFSDICNADRYTMDKTNKSDARLIPNRNSLVSTYYYTKYYNKYAYGMCVGSDNEGFGIVTVAKKSGLTYICVFMQIENEDVGYTLANNCINYFMSNYGYVKLIGSYDQICTVKVNLADKKSEINLVPQSDINIFMPLYINTETDIKYSYSLNSDSIDAPVKEGQVCGLLTVINKNDNSVLASVNLVASEDAEQGAILGALAAIGNYTSGRAFRATLVFLALAAIIFFSVRYVRSKKNKRRRNYF